MAGSENTEIFGSTIACECGKTHVITPRWIVYQDDAIQRLPEMCAMATGNRRAAVLMDVRTRGVAGGEAAEMLRRAGWSVEEVVVGDRAGGASPVCDDHTKDALHRRVGAADVMVPVGSGVINDLGKWLAAERGLPFVTFATAASMNGYTSANVAPTVDGVKTLLRAAPPAAVLSGPTILCGAPYELTAEGLGDVLAKSVSSADWYLNHWLFGDYYCQRSVGLIARIEPLYLERPRDLAARKPAAVAAIFDALLLTGAAMTMAETSAPSSGGEHMVSHTLDMMSQVDSVAHDLHGRQVGVGTVMAAELYRRVLAVERPRFVVRPGGIDEVFWGKLAPAVAAEYEKKGQRLAQACRKLSDQRAWNELRRHLSSMLRPPGKIRDCLRLAGAAYRAADIGCDRDRLLAALTHAHEIRSRFTILDLARLMGLMPDCAPDLVG